ncbi:MAG: polysaccharide deacetylase family protein [Beijerinckiaceae bacterium]
MMKFELVIPAHRETALVWVSEFVFREVLGFNVEFSCAETDEIVLRAGEQQLVLTSVFPNLREERESWHLQTPVEPLATADLAALGLLELAHLAPLPNLYGAPTLTITPDRIHCGIDIFGSIFFMLSRFEEVVRPEHDAHDRFPANASLAFRADFLLRPIVDEYIDLLWTLMKRLWPGIERLEPNGRIHVSCDVDQPFDRVKSNPRALVRGLGGDLLVRKSLGTAAKRATNFVTHRFGTHRFDPFYNFEWYMDVCEKAGLRAAFYFIADHSGGAMDGDYNIFEPRILALMRAIHRRGHEIGMHGSYNTFRDPEQMLRERARLQDALRTAGLDPNVAGNRQHYLRWDSAQTPDILDLAGFQYDTTGSFADHPGFRYGTSRSFPMWSWQRHAPLRLRQRPLVLMECSVLGEGYMNFGYTHRTFDLMKDLRRAAISCGGDFTLLWHNSHLLTHMDRMFFEKIIVPPQAQKDSADPWLGSEMR